MATFEAEPRMLLAAGDPYVVRSTAIVRARASKASVLVGEVARGTRVAADAYAELADGTVRLRLDAPVRGWVSAKLLEPLSLRATIAATQGDGAKWYYGWLRDVLLRDVAHVFVPVGDDFFGEYGRRRADYLPANDDDKVAARAALLAGCRGALLVWNDFEHDRDVVERFVDAAPSLVRRPPSPRRGRTDGAPRARAD